MATLPPRYAPYPPQSYAPAPYAPAPLPQANVEQLIADEKELKKERLWATGWGILGPFAMLGTWMFKQPEKAATSRQDVLYQFPYIRAFSIMGVYTSSNV
jgi:hypothetical protein